jgi:hypothetical protein
MPTPTPETLARLQARREEIRAAAETLCLETRRQGRERFEPEESRRITAYTTELRDIDHDLAEMREDVQRGQIPEKYAHLGVGGERRATKSGAMLAPLEFGRDEMRRMQAAAQRGDPCRIEMRAPGLSTADALLPAHLFPAGHPGGSRIPRARPAPSARV